MGCFVRPYDDNELVVQVIDYVDNSSLSLLILGSDNRPDLSVDYKNDKECAIRSNRAVHDLDNNQIATDCELDGPSVVHKVILNICYLLLDNDSLVTIRSLNRVTWPFGCQTEPFSL